MADFLTDKPAKLERAFLIGVQTAEMETGEAAELLAELKELVENLRITVARAELVTLASAVRDGAAGLDFDAAASARLASAL